MAKQKENAVSFRFSVGDVVECQGALLKVVKQVVTKDGRPAYDMRSPYTTGACWLVGEWALENAKKSRKRF